MEGVSPGPGAWPHPGLLSSACFSFTSYSGDQGGGHSLHKDVGGVGRGLGGGAPRKSLPSDAGPTAPGEQVVRPGSGFQSHLLGR